MSPWGLIGWLLAGLAALALTLVLYFGSLALNWVPWAAPVLLWVPLILFGLARLFLAILGRSGPAPAALPDPSNPFTGQWEAIKSGLPGQGLPLYLLVGDDDQAKRGLLSRSLGPADYQAAPSGPEGLCLWVADGRAWLNVPAALWTNQAPPDGPQAALIGDWGHLVKLLPGFPGSLAGLVVLMDPAGLLAEAEDQGRRLARKLSALPVPDEGPLPWRLLLHPLESLPEGRRLEAALRHWSQAGPDLWDRPFGLELPQGRDLSGPSGPGRGSDLAVSLNRALADLKASLTEYLRRADYSPQPPPLSREVLPLAAALEKLPLGLLAAGLDEGRKAPPGRPQCRGLYLTLNSAEGHGQFSRFLFQHLMPAPAAAGRGPGSPFFRRAVLAGALLLSALGLGLMVHGQWRGGQVLALAEELRITPVRAGGRPVDPPPVTDLAFSSDLVLKMTGLAGGTAGLYTAPGRAAETGRAALAEELRLYLSSPGPRALARAVNDWAGRGLKPLTFPVPQNFSSVLTPSFATGEGRRQTEELIKKWGLVLDPPYEPALAELQAGCDREILQTWQRAAVELDAALIVGPETLRLTAEAGLTGAGVGLDFLGAAGRELSALPWAESPPWLRLARELNLIQSWAGVGDLADDDQDWQSILKRLRHTGRPLGVEGLDQLMDAVRAWREYQSALSGLAALGRSPKGLTALAEEMFAGAPPPPERSSLTALQHNGQEALNRLEDLAGAPDGEERDLAARLFLSPVRWLIQSSVAAAAQHLEEQWRRQVLLPARDLSGAERAELLLGEDGALAAFREGPARPYLEAGPQGYRPAKALGQPFPWSRDFLKFINSNQEAWRRAAGGPKDLKISARLRPVRAEGPAVINHPLGVRLEMVCEVGRFKAETFNSPAVFQAQWTAQDCGPLSLTVIFRDFTLSKQYSGTAGLIDFVKSAARGELRLSADDFPDRAHLMKSAGAEAVVLGLELEKGPALLKTLSTPPPRLNPPTRIIAEARP